MKHATPHHWVLGAKYALARSVYERRRQKRLSIKALAKEARVRPHTITLIERGDSDDVGLRQLSSIATALGCRVNLLFKIETQPPRLPADGSVSLHRVEP
jgi:transcriptional regulator with XRE-family HTH domain